MGIGSYASLSKNLATLNDVHIPSPGNGYGLTYVSARKRWEAKPVVQATFNKIATSDVVSVLPLETSLIFEYTMDEVEEGTLMHVSAKCDGLGELLVTVNDIAVGTGKNSYLAQDINFIQNIPLIKGNTIKCFIKNASFLNETNSYSVWLYLREG